MKANKKLSIAAIALGICALSCAASGAVAFAAETQATGTETTEPTTVLKMQDGASIRAFEPTGIRFTSELSKEDYDNLIANNYTFGTLIIPASGVPAGGITIDNYKKTDAVTVQAQNSIAVDEVAGKVTFSGTLVGTDLADFPSTFYNVPLTAVSYYADANGAIVEFASNPQTYSIAYIASALQAEGQTDPYYTTITDSVLSDGFTFGEQSYSVKAGATAATALTSQGLKAVYSSNDTSIVTVGKDGKLKGVGGGTATVTATIGGKTATANVTVNSIFANNPIFADGTRMFAESVDENGNVSVKPAKVVYSEREATFNVAASTQYYAEATFTYNVAQNWPMIGLAHFNTLNTQIEDHEPKYEGDTSGDTYNNAGKLLGRRCIESVMSGNGKFLIKDLKPTEDHWYENYTKENICLNSTFKDNSTFKTMTIAIARNGATMYTFVDGVLIKEFEVPAEYGNTTPGIISCGGNDDFTVSGINVLSGEKAKTKLDALTVIEQSTFGNNPTLSDGSKLYTENKDANGNIIVSSNKRGEFAATFNMDASTLYYAEATFNITNTQKYLAFGLAHFTALNTSVNEAADTFDAGSYLGRACVASIKSGTSATFFIGNLTASIQRWHEAANTGNELYKKGDFQANNFTQMTVAIARTADTLYTFVNGKLVKEIDASKVGYNNVETTPGIITIGDENKFSASNIKLLSGNDAQAKIDALTATKA